MAAIADRFDLGSLRKCVSAGEALPDATRQAFKQATGIEIIDGIGSTEMIHIFISHTPERVRRGATGYAIPGYRATVLDEDGRPCAPGKVGGLRSRADRLPLPRRRPAKNYVRTAGTSPAMRTWWTRTATSSTRRAPTT